MNRTVRPNDRLDDPAFPKLPPAPKRAAPKPPTPSKKKKKKILGDGGPLHETIEMLMPPEAEADQNVDLSALDLDGDNLLETDHLADLDLDDGDFDLLEDTMDAPPPPSTKP